MMDYSVNGVWTTVLPFVKKIQFDHYLMLYSSIVKFQVDQQFKHKKQDYTRNRKSYKNVVYNLGYGKRPFKIKHKVQKT